MLMIVGLLISAGGCAASHGFGEPLMLDGLLPLTLLGGGGEVWSGADESGPRSTSSAMRQRPTTRGGAATRPSTRPAGRRSYTAPGTHYRKLGLFPILAAPGAIGNGRSSRGKEAAERPLGRRELGPSVEAIPRGLLRERVVVRSVGVRGLMGGSTLGGSRIPNVFTPLANPTAQFCGDLVGAGLFANVSSCRRYLGRSRGVKE